MECPLCRKSVMHAKWASPLQLPPPNQRVARVIRDVIQAAPRWAISNSGRRLSEYLKTSEGRPYTQMWSAAEVQLADDFVAQNP